tara:strand:+ start:2289 stop:2486 length:198 start_codon:yes stop_codon:yes gene_type:complete
MFPNSNDGQSPMSPMSFAGKAAVMDLGLGSQLADQAALTNEERKKRLNQIGGAAVESLLGNPYGV